MLQTSASDIRSARVNDRIEIRPLNTHTNVLRGYTVVELVQVDVKRNDEFTNQFGREKFDDWGNALELAEEAYGVKSEFTTSGKNLAVKVHSRRPGRVNSVVQYILHDIQKRESGA